MNNFKIHKLEVKNFRNLQQDIIQFYPHINCIVGKNGNGKTNILEAIHVLINRKSFRKKTGFPQFLSIDSEKDEIIFNSVFLEEENKPVSYTAKMMNKSSSWYLNNSVCKRKPNIEALFISPFDSYNFFNSAAFRRSWFDQQIGVLDKSYKAMSNKYTNTLRFRNSLLSKKPSKYREQIQAIDHTIAEYSEVMTRVRLEKIEEINQHCSAAFKKIFAEEHNLHLSLESKFISLSKQQIFDYLQEKLPKDEIIGFTSYGIHKDDFAFFFDGLNSLEYCSLGQQKMSYLSLLFAYIELFRYKFRAYPIVLIDDISGELDEFRWEKLVRYLDGAEFQVLITTANEKFIMEFEKFCNINKIEVANGEIKNIV